MKSLILFIFMLGTVYSSDVIDLSDDIFADEVLNKDVILVEFYAPWCGHCKRLAPEFDIAAAALLKNDPPVALAKVDCTEAGKSSCQKYGVSGYPTLKIFRNGQPSDYEGPRESRGIIDFMRKQAGPSSVLLKDKAHMDKKLADADGNIIIGFFDSEDSSFAKKFMKTVDQQRDNYQFAHTFDSALAGEHAGSVVMFRPKFLHAKFEPATYSFKDADASTLDLVKFYDDNALGMVGHMHKDNDAKFSKPTVNVYFKLDWKLNPKGGKYIRNRVARVAKKFTGKASFAVAAKQDFDQKIIDWGVDMNDVVVAASNAKQQVFLMKSEWSVDNLEKFVTEFLAGDLEPHIKSEELPADNSGGVQTVVGKNFDSVVMDPTKDVLIEFYAPWCGHCKTLEPKWNELGEKFAGNKDIVIAKMDATANDAPPQFAVKGFPTLYWAPMGKKDNPVKYEGGRDVSDFVEYIKKSATNPVELKDEL